jgi:protein-S-isoprenylcysteine O-methyltransferase Ste14
LWNGSALALFAGLMTPLTMTAWLRWVEEPELIERFGDGYRAYRARVPAFFNLNPRIWPVVWRFLLTGQ